MATQAGTEPERKFLRAFRCLLRWGSPSWRGSGPWHAVPGVAVPALVGGPTILLLAALVPPLRPVAGLALFAGWAGLLRRRSPAAVGWAAVLPVALAIAWPWIAGGDAPLGAAGCIEPLSVIVLRRVGLAGAVLGTVALLAVIHRSSTTELGLRRPTRAEASIAVGGAAALAAVGLTIGPWVASIFFGRLSFPIPPAVFVPALVFGTANGVLEEVAYRGALQAWLGRLAPLWVAIAFQGLVFGIVHAGPEVIAMLPLHVGVLTGVGVAGGVLRARTSSLVIPIGIHVGADIALYVGLACRTVA